MGLPSLRRQSSWNRESVVPKRWPKPFASLRNQIGIETSCEMCLCTTSGSLAMAAYVMLLVTPCCFLAPVKVLKAHGPVAMLKAKSQPRLQRTCGGQQSCVAQPTVHFIDVFVAICTELTIEHD